MLPSTLLGMLSRTLRIALDGTLPACLTIRSQVSFQDALKSTLSNTLPIALDDTSLLNYMVPSTLRVRSQVHLLVRSQVHHRACSQGRSELHSMAHSQPVCYEVSSQDALKHTPEHALKREDTLNLTSLYAPMYAPACSIWRLAELQTPVTRMREAGGVWRTVFSERRVACGVWRVAGGRRRMLDKIMTSVDMVV